MQPLLQLWDQAGERPYEVLIEEGVYDEFLRYLDSSRVYLDGPIFRGTRRHQGLVKGDLLDYGYPTAWTTRVETAFNFVQGEERPVILALSSNELVKGIDNPYNTYGENEVVLAPITLRVDQRYDYPDYILLKFSQ